MHRRFARLLGYRTPGSFKADAPRLFLRCCTRKRHRAVISGLPYEDLPKIETRVNQALKNLKDGSDVRGRAVHGANSLPNYGFIVAVKDNFVTTKLPTTCASAILEGFTGPRSSHVVHELRFQGMEVVAKTNMDEFGMGSHSTNSAYGAVRNGWARNEISVGGSSGGSAVAVADDLAHFAIGSDTGGSIRLPAAYMNLMGFKPSYGMISRAGLIPYANSLDTVGILAKTGLDIFMLFKHLNAPDWKDPTCLTQGSRYRIHIAKRDRTLALASQDSRNQDGIPLRVSSSYAAPWHYGSNIPNADRKKTWKNMLRPSQKRRIGVPLEYNIEEMHPTVRKAWTRTLSLLQSRGHEIVPISLPTTKQALAAYYVIAPAEASSNLAKYDGVRYGAPRRQGTADDHGDTLYAEHRGTHFGDEVKRRILLGSYSLSAGAMDNYFIQAQKVRRLVQRDFNMVFRMAHPLCKDAQGHPNGVDYIVCPTAPTPPPLLSEVEQQTPLHSYINDVFTVPASLAGLPAYSMPVVHNREIPRTPERAVGIQIIGQYGDDLGVINFGRLEIEPSLALQDLKRMVSGHKIY